MKKLLLVFALLLASRASFAAYASGGNILQSQTKYNTSTGYLTLDIDWSGMAAGGFSLTTTGNVSITAGTAYIGAIGISGTAGQAITTSAAADQASQGFLANMAGAYLDISRTSLTGITANAAVTRSLTFMAGTSSGIVVPDIIGCAGMTTGYYQIHDGVTPPAFFTANPSQGSSFLCGTSHYYEARKFLGASPHITVYAGGLSFTSGTFSFGLLSRTAQ